jgi:hypothetical protein
MTISVKMLNDEIRKISETNTLLDMLLEFERVLEDIDLYSYKNWHLGEILGGPVFDRHYITVTLMYKEKHMPDPLGAKRLFALGCVVNYDKNKLIKPVKVRTLDDITTEVSADGRTRTRAKTKTEPVWTVKIKMPRRFVDEFSTEVLEADSEDFVDTESLNTEEIAQAEQQATGNIEEFGDEIKGGEL